MSEWVWVCECGCVGVRVWVSERASECDLTKRYLSRVWVPRACVPRACVPRACVPRACVPRACVPRACAQDADAEYLLAVLTEDLRALAVHNQATSPPLLPDTNPPIPSPAGLIPLYCV